MNAGSLYPADNKIARDDQIPGRYLIYRIPLSFQGKIYMILQLVLGHDSVHVKMQTFEMLKYRI